MSGNICDNQRNQREIVVGRETQQRAVLVYRVNLKIILILIPTMFENICGNQRNLREIFFV